MPIDGDDDILRIFVLYRKRRVIILHVDTKPNIYMKFLLKTKVATWIKTFLCNIF